MTIQNTLHMQISCVRDVRSLSPSQYFVGGGRMCVVAERAIRAGEEVCENYFPHYQYMDTRKRREWLRYETPTG